MEKSKVLIIDLICNQEIDIKKLVLDYKKENIEITYLKDTEQNKSPFTTTHPIDFDKFYQKAYDQAFSETIQIGEYELPNRNSIAKELVLHDNKSLWYYFRFMLLYKHRKRIFENYIHHATTLLLDQYKKVIIITDSSHLNSKKYKGIKVVYYNKREKKQLSNIFTFLAITATRFILGIPKLFNFLNSRKSHIFLSNANAEQNILSINDFTLKKGDHFTEYFQEEIDNKAEFINISEFFPPKLTSETKIFFKRQYLFSRFNQTVNFETLLYLQLLNPLFYLTAATSVNKLRKSFKIIDQEKSKNQLFAEFKSYKRLCYFVAVRKSAIFWILKYTKFKSISSSNEHDTRVKSIQEVASKIGIKTFGIQHGVIHFRHLHYCFSDFDSKYKPFPDYTFVWGNYWNDVLKKISSYNSNQLINVGQIRTDIIPQINQLKKEELISTLDKEKITILYPSQPLYVGEEAMRERLALNILQLCNDFPKVQIIIKPHPKEIDCIPFFNKLAKQINATNFIILNEDLYKTLAYSDAVIVYNSTVGAEAIYFKKPLIVMNYADNDFSGFIENKVAKEVKNYEALKESVHKIIEKEELIPDNQTEKFIADRAYKIDGKVSRRIIDNIIQKSNI